MLKQSLIMSSNKLINKLYSKLIDYKIAGLSLKNCDT
ncbi:hypothetical protein SLITO_v1c05760 [Spiroplasma litorale]|uniref:Uncharacterized protein n=1 Tax=Spiroplasma litorale TaxID=216942 RepID=A0A0K1W282_9MOLU|nr:hypothetical protein SLITO_v1c05760 [Spiroplasma litorale]